MFLEVLLIFVLVGHGRTQGQYAYEIPSEMSEEYEESFKGNISKRSGFPGHNTEPVNLEDLKLCKLCGIDRYPLEINIPKENKIVPIYRYPFIVALQHKRKKFCAGTIITDQFILTSAHCLIKDKTRLQKVRETLSETPEEKIYSASLKPKYVGWVQYLKPEDINIGFLTNSPWVALDDTEVVRIFPHPRFDVNNVINDIALLKLKDKLRCDNRRNPVCLPSRDMHVKQGKMFWISGWDIEWKERDYFIDNDRLLKRLKVKFVNFADKCGLFFSERLSKEYHCMENTEKKENCHADPGGPMFSKEGQKYYVFGVASLFAYDLCKKGKAFIYTNVLEHLDWINKTLALPTAKSLQSPGVQEKCKESKGKCTKH